MTDSALPLISVIVATRNAEKTLSRFLDSYAAQTYGNRELIVVDGASTDGTVALLKERRDLITDWSSQKDTGIYQAWNRALDRAKGEWICFFGADDYFWENNTLRYFYLAISVFFAYIVLVGHIHYSIDVFAAPFITYSIYQFSLFAFAKEYQFFKQELQLI